MHDLVGPRHRRPAARSSAPTPIDPGNRGLNSLTRRAGVLSSHPGRGDASTDAENPPCLDLPCDSVLLLLLGASALGWGAIRGWEAWHYHDELARAERDMASGRYAEARERLDPARPRRPGRAEVEFPSGICEASLGHVEPALEAWARVPAESVLAPGRRSSVRAGPRARRLAGGGGEPRPDRGRARRDRRGGRPARPATRPVLGAGVPHPARIERHWDSCARPGGAAPDPLALRDAALPRCRRSREALERMSREAPGDDRVWLGLADIATRTGRLDEADAGSRPARPAGPEDPDVRHAPPRVGARGRRPDVAAATLATSPRAVTRPRKWPGSGPPGRLRGDADAERRHWSARRAGARRRRGVGEARRPGDPAPGVDAGPPRAREGAQGRDRSRERRVPHAHGRRRPR